MKRRGPLFSLFVFAALITTWFAFDVVQSRTPLLGLDLQGGLSAIYSPVEEATQDDLVAIRDLMRDQLTSFGIAEPDVRVEGNNIVVDLPGVSDTAQAFEALKVSGIVTLHPVLQCGQLPTSDTAADTATATATTSPAEQVTSVDTTPSNATVVPIITAAPTTAVSSGSADQTSHANGGVSGASGRPMLKSAVSPVAAPPATDPPSPAPSPAPSPTTPPAPTTPPVSSVPTSTPTDTLPGVLTPVDNSVVSTPTGDPTQGGGQQLMPYPAANLTCLVGPSGGTGEVFERHSAQAVINPENGEWVVQVNLKPEGNAIWNTLATECFNVTAACPTQQLAIALDNQIKSAPRVNAPSFQGSVQIEGGFTQSDARALAMTLNRGAFPVEVQQQRLETVSPTAGTKSLNAAVIAGLIGIALMFTFMVVYYRRLSVVIVPGLLVWGMAVYALATLVSRSSNYALSLAGATGIIVAVGVTVDTYVVYFERLREEVRHGRTYRNSAERSFRITWRTILSADLVSLLASAVLFVLSVGSVKGFALYLGLTTICDLVVFYFFTRPLVAVLARSGWLDRGESRPAASPVGASS